MGAAAQASKGKSERSWGLAAAAGLIDEDLETIAAGKVGRSHREEFIWGWQGRQAAG